MSGEDEGLLNSKVYILFFFILLMIVVEFLCYRVEDVMRGVIKVVVREVCVKELWIEILNLECLKVYFEDNFIDLELLKYDKVLSKIVFVEYLKMVLEYLKDFIIEVVSWVINLVRVVMNFV